MTVSLEENEVGLLAIIAEGDGEQVKLTDLQTREIHILKEFLDSGYVRGVTFISGGGVYSITTSGLRHLKKLQSQLIEEERQTWIELEPALQTTKINIRSYINLGKIGAFLVGAMGLLWIIYSQAISATWLCPRLSDKVAVLLAKCDASSEDFLK